MSRRKASCPVHLVVLPDDSAQADPRRHRSAPKNPSGSRCSSSPIPLSSRRSSPRTSAGVKVRIMLNPTRRNGEKENDRIARSSPTPAVDVIDSNPAFDLTHEKSMVVDDNTAFVSRSTGRRKTSPTRATTPSSRRTSTRSTKSSSASKPTGRARSSTPGTTRI